MDQLREASTSFHTASDDAEGYWKEYSELWDEPEVECEHLHGFPEASPPHEHALAVIDAAFMDQISRPHALDYVKTCNSLSTFLEGNIDLYSTQLLETFMILSFIPEIVIKDTCVWDYYIASEARLAVTRKALEMMPLDVDLMDLNYNAQNAYDHASLMTFLEVVMSPNTYNFDQVVPAFEAEQTPSTLVEDSLNSRAPVTGLVEQPANATPSQPAVVATARAMAMLNQRAHQAVPLGRTQSLPVFPSSASCAFQARTARQPFRYPCIPNSTIYQIQE